MHEHVEVVHVIGICGVHVVVILALVSLLSISMRLAYEFETLTDFHLDTLGIFDRVVLGEDVVDGRGGGGHVVVVGDDVHIVLEDVGIIL